MVEQIVNHNLCQNEKTTQIGTQSGRQNLVPPVSEPPLLVVIWPVEAQQRVSRH